MDTMTTESASTENADNTENEPAYVDPRDALVFKTTPSTKERTSLYERFSLKSGLIALAVAFAFLIPMGVTAFQYEASKTTYSRCVVSKAGERLYEWRVPAEYETSANPLGAYLKDHPEDKGRLNGACHGGTVTVR